VRVRMSERVVVRGVRSEWQTDRERDSQKENSPKSHANFDGVKKIFAAYSSPRTFLTLVRIWQIPVFVAVCCNCVAMWCSKVLQSVAVCCSVLPRATVCYSVLQCVTMCCSVVKCGAVWCRVVQRGAL